MTISMVCNDIQYKKYIQKCTPPYVLIMISQFFGIQGNGLKYKKGKCS